MLRFVIAFFLLSGCASKNPSPVFISGEYIPVIKESEKSVGESIIAKKIITLSDVITRTLKANKTIASARESITIATKEVKVSSARPDPAINIELEDFLGTGPYKGFSSSQVSISYSQTIELGAKRMRRIESSRHQVNLARYEYELTVQQTARDAALAFLDVLYLHNRLRLIVSQVKIARAVLGVLEEQVEAGKLAEIQPEKTRASLEMLLIEQRSVKKQIETASIYLASFWGAKTPDFEGVAGKWVIPASIPDLGNFIANIKKNTRVLKWLTLVALSGAKIKENKADSVPDVTLSAGYRFIKDGNDSAVVFGVSIPIPFNSSSKYKTDVARAQHKEAVTKQKEALWKLETEINQLYGDMSANYNMVKEYMSRVIPHLVKSLKGIQEGYRMRKFGYMELLDSRQTLQEVREKLLDISFAYHKAAIKLEFLSGKAVR
ncbi:MAG: TolC family protein [Deltaproteobacteria bacterium]|nr:TolC family protein [Deltaproteobacteria bacterium]